MEVSVPHATGSRVLTIMQWMAHWLAQLAHCAWEIT